MNRYKAYFRDALHGRQFEYRRIAGGFCRVHGLWKYLLGGTKPWCGPLEALGDTRAILLFRESRNYRYIGTKHRPPIFSDYVQKIIDAKKEGNTQKYHDLLHPEGLYYPDII